MSNQSLVGRIAGFARRIAYEFSYQTGVGWEYGPNEGYFDRLSRKLQRDGTSPEGVPNTSYKEAIRDIEQCILPN